MAAEEPGISVASTSSLRPSLLPRTGRPAHRPLKIEPDQREQRGERSHERIHTPARVPESPGDGTGEESGPYTTDDHDAAREACVPRVARGSKMLDKLLDEMGEHAGDVRGSYD